MLPRLLQPQLAHLMAPYVDKASLAQTPPDVKLPTERHQLHLVDTDEWEMKKAIAETGLQGGFEVLNRRWQGSVNALTPVENFKRRYFHLIPLFKAYFCDHNEVFDDQFPLNQILDAGQIDIDLFAFALQQNLLHESNPEHIKTFLINFDWLARLVPAGRLKELFFSLPSSLMSCLVQLGDDERIKTELQKYLCASGGVDLERLLDDVQIQLLFNNYEVASLNATAGVLRGLNLRLDQVVMRGSFELDSAIVRKKFPEHEITTSSDHNRCIVIQFHDGNHFSFNYRILGLSYQPFKFGVPGRVSDAARESLRRRLGVGNERKIIVASSPDIFELSQIVEAYCRLKADPNAEPPLLILGLRDPSPALEESLLYEGLKAKVRDEKDQKNEETWTAAGESVANLDVVILNTKGELMDLFAIADLAIVGHNRNLMEPAAQGTPILYASGNWSCNQMAKTLLDQSGAAHVFDPKILHEQIRERLNHPECYRDKAEPAFATLNEQLMPDATALASLAIGIRILRDAPPKTASTTFSHPKF